VVYRVFRGTAPPAIHIGDAGYLAMLLFVCVAMLLVPAPGIPNQRAYALLDGIVVFASLFIVAWVAVLRNLAQTHFDTPLHFLVAIAYPLFDVAIVTLAISALMRSHPHHGRQVGLLAGGLMVIALANSGMLFMATRNLDTRLMIAGWMAGLVLIGIAALFWDRTGRQHVDGDPARLPALSLLLPYVPVTLSLVVAIAFFKNIDGAVPLLAASGVLILSVLTRQYLVLIQNNRLLRSASELAMRDPLTGLSNRIRFTARLQHALMAQTSGGSGVAVLLLDLDGFKLVNDTLGHLAGDTLLQETANRLSANTSRADVVARLGGDEFAVLFGAGATSPEQLAGRIIAAFDEPVVIDGESVEVRLSVGLAVADSRTITGSELMHRADTAMYTAKRSGAGGLAIFGDPPVLHDDGGDTGPGDTADRMPSASE
jgi:diguanylate cyclase